MAEESVTVPTTVETCTELAFPAKINDKKKVLVNGGTSRKKRRGVNILKAALLLLRRRSAKPTSVDVASHGMWKRLVGSVRPLHLQINRSPEQNLPPFSVPDHQSPVSEHFEDVSSPPFSPNAVQSSSSSDGMSRYASAVNLQELDQSDDEDDSDGECDGDVIGGDEMIDAKAEEFIAQFYAQMRLQRSDHRYNEMIKRSIG